MNDKKHWREGLAYLLCFGAGALLWPLTGKPSDRPAPEAGTRRSSPAEVEVQQRLADLIQSHHTDRERPDEPEAVPTTVEERTKEWLAEWEERSRTDRAHLAALLARSTAYRNVADLGPALSDAMAMGDQENDEQEETAVIFLEWYRRDPGGAFDEIARRNRSRSMFIFQDVLFLQFPSEEASRELANPLRPDEFRKYFCDGLAERLAENDELPGLITVMAGLDEPMQKKLAESFASKDWVPRDAAKTRAIIGGEMPEAARKVFLSALASQTPGHLSEAWSKGAGKDLLEQTLGASEVKRLGEVAQRELELLMQRQCGGGDSDDYFDSPVTAMEEGLSEKDAVSAFSSRLSLVMEQEKDYYECFASGLLTAPEILAEVGRKIPGSDAYPQALARALYKELAPHDPEKAAAWGRETIPAAALADETRAILQYNEDPRASRITELIRQLPATLPEDDGTKWFVENIQTRFRDWKALDPDAARIAAGSIPDSHPLHEAAKGEDEKEEQEEEP